MNYKEKFLHWTRFFCRYIIAYIMIPIGVLLGVIGVVDYWCKKND